jgi:hypothetical protein
MKLLPIFLFAINVFSQTPTKDEKVFQYPDFGKCGLVTRYASNKINLECLTDIKNIVFDEDASILRRNGYSKYNSSPCGDGKKIRGMWTFNATDNQKYMVFLASQTLYYSKGDGQCTAIISGLNATNDMQCVQSLGKLWCVNGVDNNFYWDGTSTGTFTLPSNAKPTLIDTFANRLIVGNISGELSRIRLSGEGNGTDWTLEIPGYSTSPASIDISGTNDGKRITCLMGTYQGAYLIGREDDLYALYGYDRRNFSLVKLSNEIGCIDQNSVKEKNNALYWLSKRGIERMSGTSIERVSDPIRPNVDEIIKSAGNKRTKTYDTQSEWEAGLTNGEWTSTTIDPGNVVPSTWSKTDTTAVDFGYGTLVNVSTTIIDGSLILSYNMNLLDNFDDGNYTNNPTWNILNGGSYNPWSVSNYAVNFQLNQTGVYGGYLYTSTSTLTMGKWSFKLTHYRHADNVMTYSRLYFISKGNDVSFQEGVNYLNQYANTDGYLLDIQSKQYELNTYIISLKKVASRTPTTLLTFQTTKDNMDSNLWYIERDRNGKFTITLGTITQSVTDTTYNESNYILLYCVVSGYPQDYITFDSIYTPMYYFSGTFTSQVFNTGIPTPVGGPFDVTYSTPAETQIDYFVRYASSPYGTWSDWTATSDTLRIVAPKQYWQYKANFYTNYSTVTPQIDDVTLNATSTGYYIPDCIETTGVTSWGNYRPTYNLNGNATLKYYVTSGNSCNQVTRSTASWTEQSPNIKIAVDTAPYLGTKIEFTPTSTTETIKLDALTLEWNEGEQRPPVASSVYRDRYWLFYTTNTATEAHNDSVLVLDSNDKWTLFDDINAYSAVIYNRELYTGDSQDTGYIYKQDVGLDDNGNSFDYKLITNDNDFGNPYSKKILKRVYLVLKSEEISGQNIDLSVKYYIDGSTTAYSMGTVGLSEAKEKGYFVAKFFPSVATATAFHWIKFEIANNQGKQGPIHLYNILAVYREIGWD